MTSLLSINNLKIAYSDDNWAVDEVSFQLEKGEVRALVGESGSGKSTIGKSILRLLPSQSTITGDIYFQGESIFSYSPSRLRKFRGEAVGLVFQDPMTRLNPLMTIGHHCVETLQTHQPNLTFKQAKSQVLMTLEMVKIAPDRFEQYPHEFSGGMRQRVAIALALLLEPKLIIADEPTTSLDVTISRQILAEFTYLCREKNVSLLLISHDLAMVSTYSDYLSVMYQGKIVETGLTKEIISAPHHSYTQQLFNSSLAFNPPSLSNLKSLKNSHSEIILEIRNLQKTYSLEANIWQKILGKKSKLIKAVDDINLQIYQGEIIGLVGESGCGKSTLSRTILQLIKPTAGQVNFQGKNLVTLKKNSLKSVRRQLQMIFQDPQASLNPMMTVLNILSEPLIIHKLGNKKEIRSKVEKMLIKVGLTPVETYLSRYPKQLSGGQQQRVAVARALITNSQLIICDEAVSMLDATIQSQVLELMLNLKAEFNLTYLFITHDLAVARYFCHRIAVMYQGKIVELAPTAEIFNNPQHPYTQSLLKPI